MQNLLEPVIRSTLGFVFSVGTLEALVALVAVGCMGVERWLDSLALVPWMLWWALPHLRATHIRYPRWRSALTACDGVDCSKV